MGGIIETTHFIDRQRARADEAHFSAQNVKELRKFINTVLAQEPPDSGHTRIVGDLEDRPAHFIERSQFMFPLFGIADHRAELQHGKRLAVKSTALLPEKNRPWGGPTDGDGG